MGRNVGRSPVRVRASEQRVRRPEWEVEVNGLRDCDIGIHGLKNVHDLGLDLGGSELLDIE